MLLLHFRLFSFIYVREVVSSISFVIRIAEQKIEVEVLKDKCQKLRMIVAEKEQEIELQKQTTEDGQFLKISELETDKSNLELELCNLERRMKEIDDQCQLESNELHDKISTYENETKALKEHNERLRYVFI